MGIIGLVLGIKAISLHNSNPDMYEGIGNAKAGKIMSIIGLVLSVLFILYIIWIISYFGWEVMSNRELLLEKLKELQ
jgi:hypothetical protein